MQLILSVIICTHNPRHDYFERVLQALKAQTLSVELWELLLIDNASERRLSEEIDLSWHPHSRQIREEQLGLTPARLRGIKEAVAETLVFVDDDNVLDTDYLEVALQISKEWPIMGAWGGQIKPDFEEQPPDWTKPYWAMLAIREFNQNQWSNLVHQCETTPWGAGMCVRKTVAEKYAELVRNDPDRAGMDRTGKLLISCGDMDLAYTACDIGLGTGVFISLRLTHLIPPGRLEEAYLLKLMEANGYSLTKLESFRGKMPSFTKPSWRGKILENYRLWRMSPRERRFETATKRGINLASSEILYNSSGEICSE